MSNENQLEVKKLHESATLPTYGTDGAAGLDLYALEDTILLPGVTTIVRTGVAVKLPHRTFGSLCPRSGLAIKSGITVVNSPGVIDEDYRGEIMVAARNLNKWQYKVKAGDRVAQMIVQNYVRVNIAETEALDSTQRGEGRHGSTGR